MLIRSLAAATVALLSTNVAMAADLIIPTTPEPIMESAGFSWDGLYAGAQFGGLFYPEPVPAYGSIGVHAGVNFVVADPVVIGVEASADYLNNGGPGAGQYFVNGRAGMLVSDAVLLYAIAGAGIETYLGTSYGVYQLGGGVELAVTEAITLRGQLTGMGYFDPAARVNLFDGVRATAGISYHF